MPKKQNEKKRSKINTQMYKKMRRGQPKKCVHESVHAERNKNLQKEKQNGTL